MQAIFYQKYWHIIRKHVCHKARSFHINGHLLKEPNKTYINPGSKEPHPDSVLYLEPISLYNVSYIC